MKSKRKFGQLSLFFILCSERLGYSLINSSSLVFPSLQQVGLSPQSVSRRSSVNKRRIGLHSPLIQCRRTIVDGLEKAVLNGARSLCLFVSVMNRLNDLPFSFGMCAQVLGSVIFIVRSPKAHRGGKDLQGGRLATENSYKHIKMRLHTCP